MSARTKGAARAVCDVTEGVILATVEIASPPERVFRALTDATDIVAWWGSDATYRTTSHVADLRVGGHWRSEGKGSDGHAFAVEGEFLELDAPSKLVLTWKPDWDAGNVTTITYRLEAIENGTRLSVRHEGFSSRTDSCRGHTAGWEQVLGWLNAFVDTAPALRAFMCRLLPPRPTFMQDMSAEERALMMQHSAYWRTKLAEGRAIVFGPVAAPEGGFGLGVLRAENMDEMHAFAAKDPVIVAERGFRYEILPLVQVVF